MPVVGAAAHRPVAKAAQGVAFGIEPAGQVGRVPRVQQVPFFDREQKDEPIDEPQELPEVAIGREIAGVQRGPQLRVRGVGQEPLPQDLQRLLKAGAEAVACLRSLLSGLLPPQLQRAGHGRSVRATEAGLVREQPEGGEVRVQILGKDSGQVGFDPRGARETGVVARDP